MGAGGGEVDAEGGVLGLVPARSQPQLQPASGHVVDGDGLPGQEGGVTEGVGADQHADADAMGSGGERRQQGPGLEVGTIRSAGLDEVIAQPDAVEAELLVQQPALQGPLPAQVLIGAQPKAKLVSHIKPPHGTSVIESGP